MDRQKGGGGHGIVVEAITTILDGEKVELI